MKGGNKNLPQVLWLDSSPAEPGCCFVADWRQYTRRQIIEPLDVRGKIAYENGEKVIYLKCLIPPEQQPLYPVPTSHWRCNLKRTAYMVSVRLVIPIYGGSLPEIAYKNTYAPVAMGA